MQDQYINVDFVTCVKGAEDVRASRLSAECDWVCMQLKFQTSNSTECQSTP
jgi:hypothetical protein